jgi:DNA primase
MPKIEQHRIDAIKRDVSLLNWIENEGHEPKKEGNDYVMACVFHEDKTPSLKITPHKNLYHCFGCGAAGSVIDWVMNTQALDFRAAVEHMEQQGGAVVLKAANPQPAQSSLAADITDTDQQTALQGVIDYYHESLKKHIEAQAYLDSRGLNDLDLINTFKLGFSNKALNSILAAKHTQAGKQQRQLLRATGILKKSGYEHFAGSVVVPVFDNGQCVEIYGRRIQKYSDPKHLYMPGPHVGVWNASGFKNTDTMIFCEALIDAMTFWVNGFKNTTASYGTGGFTAEHLKQIKEHNITKVLIAYDRDKAGNDAADKLADKLSKENIHCYRINFPKNMDANSYALQVQPAHKSLGLVIEKAEPMLDALKLESPKNTITAPVHPAPTALERPCSSNAAQNPSSEQAIPSLVAKQTLSTETTPEQKKQLIITETDANISCGNRHYRVRGLKNNTRLDQLKINLLIKITTDNNDALHYVDHLDLYQSKARKHYIQSASDELGLETGIIKKDLGKLLLALEDHQEQQLNGQVKLDKDKQTELTPDQKKAALDLLTDKNLINRISEDINAIGVVGEDSNALVGYLACVSRKLDNPLAIMIQSTSAAGKSALMDSVLSLMPDNEQHKFAAMTGQSLYYMGEMDLKHNILAIAEEEGAHSASYALKLLQSEGEVSIASTGKNETTGDLETRTYQVEGPVMLMMTTTAIDIDEELMNRCLVLSVNETRQQTEAIHAIQRKKRTLDGLKQKVQKQTITEQHHHAQDLLKPLAVINPYAEHLTFLSDKTRTRRDHEKYLTLIDSIALLHQYQRETKHLVEGESTTDYIEVTLNDIEIANQLAHDVLGRSLDELPPQTRKLLNLISDMVRKNCKKEKIEQSDYRFSRKDIRAYSGWSDGQLKIHCRRLEDMEYLLVHKGSRGNSIQYELLYTVDDVQNKMLSGLIDVNALKKLSCVEEKSGQKEQKIAPSQAQVSPKSGGSQGNKKPAKPTLKGLNGKNKQKRSKEQFKEEQQQLQLYGSIAG